MPERPKSDRVRVRRLPARGAYDRDTIDAILDEGLVCHLGFQADGQTYVIPMGYARDGDRVLVHGSAASRMLRAIDGQAICVTVTLVDALVLARSIFHHSMNYRSVVVLGKATKIEDDNDKIAALRKLSEHLIPGRWDDCRLPNEKELKATTVLSMPIDEASAKIRTGPPGDEEEDYDLPHWAGVIPFATGIGTPEPDPRLADGIDIPEYVRNYTRKKETRT